MVNNNLNGLMSSQNPEKGNQFTQNITDQEDQKFGVEVSGFFKCFCFASERVRILRLLDDVGIKYNSIARWSEKGDNDYKPDAINIVYSFNALFDGNENFALAIVNRRWFVNQGRKPWNFMVPGFQKRRSGKYRKMILDSLDPDLPEILMSIKKVCDTWTLSVDEKNLLVPKPY